MRAFSVEGLLSFVVLELKMASFILKSAVFLLFCEWLNGQSRIYRIHRILPKNMFNRPLLLITTVAIMKIIPNTITTASSIDHTRARHVDCERQCPFIYYPICATNGNETENRMFVNHCEMTAWNCDAEKSMSDFHCQYYFSRYLL